MDGTGALEMGLRGSDAGDGHVRLTSPGVGLFTCARTKGEVLVAGQRAGALDTLGVPRVLIVPAGVSGRIVSAAPERVHQPVEHGTTLYQLAPLQAPEQESASERDGASAVELAVLAPYSGRFWHRPAPSDPPYLEVGDVIEAGHKLGLIEIMKTFTHLHYEPAAGLPERARVVRLLISDGEEVARDEPLIEVEPA